MFTEIYDKKNGKTYSFVSQQYEVGLYFIINNDPSLQGSAQLEENEYHKRLRIKAIKNDDIISNGSIVDYKGKYKINEFKSKD